MTDYLLGPQPDPNMLSPTGVHAGFVCTREGKLPWRWSDPSGPDITWEIPARWSTMKQRERRRHGAGLGTLA